MKSDNAIWNGTSIFVGIIVAIAAFVRGALLLPLLLVACSIWGTVCAAPSAQQATGSPQEESKGTPPHQVCGAGH